MNASAYRNRGKHACWPAKWLLVAGMVAAQTALAHWPVRPLASVDVYDRTSGTVLAVFEKDGQRYVVGTPGHEYEIRIRNRTGERILAVTSVDGVNVARKSQRPTRTTQQGGIIDKDMPLPVSNVALVCPSCGKPTRVGFKIDASGDKVRQCKKCGGEIT